MPFAKIGYSLILSDRNSLNRAKGSNSLNSEEESNQKSPSSIPYVITDMYNFRKVTQDSHSERHILTKPNSGLKRSNPFPTPMTDHNYAVYRDVIVSVCHLPERSHRASCSNYDCACMLCRCQFLCSCKRSGLLPE